MAFQNAKGNGPATGMPRTPAPTKPAAPDLISRVRDPHGSGYGSNDGANNPSSINPGKQMLSPMAQNLKASSDDGESALDTVIAKGVSMDTPDWQMRAVSSKGYPINPGTQGAAKGPSIPDRLGASVAQLVQKPGR